MEEITLTKDCGYGKAGAVLRVLRAEEDPEPGTVDRRKAESLVEDYGVALWGRQEPEAPKPVKPGKKGVAAHE